LTAGGKVTGGLFNVKEVDCGLFAAGVEEMKGTNSILTE
jgi:hypothetical protein